MNAKKAMSMMVASAMVMMFLGFSACSTTPISTSDKEQQQDSGSGCSVNVARQAPVLPIAAYVTAGPPSRDGSNH